MNTMEKADKQIHELEDNYGVFRHRWAEEDGERKAFVLIYDEILKSYQIMKTVDNDYIWKAFDTQIKKDKIIMKRICRQYSPAELSRKPHKRLTYSDREIIEKMLNRGERIVDIAEKIGVDRTTGYNEIHRCGGTQENYNAREVQEKILKKTAGDFF